MKLAIELSDAQAERLREEASRLGVEPEQLALAAVADLIAAEGPDFDAAASRVLGKNRELYPSIVEEALLADPRWPRFSVSHLWYLHDDELERVGSATFGESFSVVRSPGRAWGQ